MVLWVNSLCRRIERCPFGALRLLWLRPLLFLSHISSVFWVFLLGLFLLRRPALSCFRACYSFVQRFRHCPSAVPMWASVRKELEIALGFLPLCFASIARPFSNRLVAFDASSSGCGVVSASISSLAAPSFMASNASALRWSWVASFPWRFKAHINALEISSALVSLRWLASIPSVFATRSFFLSDSRAVIGALRKGRSSSPALRRACRIFGAFVLAMDLLPLFLWLPSCENPADAPSRHF